MTFGQLHLYGTDHSNWFDSYKLPTTEVLIKEDQLVSDTGVHRAALYHSPSGDGGSIRSYVSRSSCGPHTELSVSPLLEENGVFGAESIRKRLTFPGGSMMAIWHPT